MYPVTTSSSWPRSLVTCSVIHGNSDSRLTFFMSTLVSKLGGNFVVRSSFFALSLNRESCSALAPRKMLDMSPLWKWCSPTSVANTAL